MSAYNLLYKMAGEDTRYPGGAIVCKKTSNNEDSNDRISDLPDEILDYILGRLPLPDVVRTRVLSKRWSNCWTRHGKLDFGPDFVKKYVKGDDKEYKYVKIVDSILLQQKSPVLKFDLSLVCGVIPTCWSSHLDRWINYLWEHDIRDLTIYGRGHLISATLFKCSGLRSLRLVDCELEPSKGFNGFPYLTNLEIYLCTIPKTEWEIMIDSPSLQTLRICSARGDPIQVGGSQIKSLIVDFDESHPVCLKKSPNLTDATIRTLLILPESHNETYELNQLARLLPRIKTLVLAGLTLDSLACDNLPSRLPTMLNNLEHLELHFIDIFSLMELSCAFCLIRSSPNLQSLVISVIYEGGTDDDEKEIAVSDFLTAQPIEGIMSGIQAVTLIDLQGSGHEVDFICTIIDCCPKLESIQVAPSPNDDFDKEWFSAELSSFHGSLLFLEPFE